MKFYHRRHRQLSPVSCNILLACECLTSSAHSQSRLRFLRAFAHARNPQLRLDKKASIVQVIPKTIIDHAFSQSSKLHLLPQNPEYQMLLTYLRITFCDCWDMMVKLTDRMMAVREGGFRGREVSRNLYQSR